MHLGCGNQMSHSENDSLSYQPQGRKSRRALWKKEEEARDAGWKGKDGS